MTDSRIRVLHIGLSPNLGGLESFVHNMYLGINQELIAFDFLNIYSEPLAYENEYREQGCVIHHITQRKKNPIKSYVELSRLLKEEQYDYVHFHCMTYCWPEPIIIGSNVERTQVIVHSHLTGFNENTPIKERLLHTIGKFRIRNKKPLCLACGIDAGKWLFPNKEYYVIENGINTKLFRYNTQNRVGIREKYNLQEKDIVIGHVGNFSYQKNYPYLLSVFEYLHNQNPNYKLLLVGNDKLAGEVKTIIKEYRLDDSVIFTGLINNTAPLYSAMDLYLFPSHYEGFNISLIEAQCAGLDCFVSNKLDTTCNVGGNYHIIDIDASPAASGQIILSSNYCLERANTFIDFNYDIENAAKKLESFYINNRKVKHE